MPSQQITGTVTRKSNGTIEIQPSDPGTFTKLPAMGDEVTVSIEVTRSASEIERANAVAKRDRATIADRADVVESAPALASVPAVERRAKR